MSIPWKSKHNLLYIGWLSYQQPIFNCLSSSKRKHHFQVVVDFQDHLYTTSNWDQLGDSISPTTLHIEPEQIPLNGSIN